jgi:tetratricopeptide (TPR) repeat protein
MAHLEMSCPHCGKRLISAEADSSPCCDCGGEPLAATVTPARETRRVRRIGRPAFTAGAAILVIGIAAAVVYPTVRDELERARIRVPVQAPAPVAVATAAAVSSPIRPVPVPGDPSERCELRIFRDQAGGAPIAVLTEPGKMTDFRPNYYGNRGRLFRELVRQAVLMAARDVLRLPVRDAVVGDLPPAGTPAQTIEIDALSRGDQIVLAVCREDGKKREVLFEKTVRSGPTNLGDYKSPVTALERLARDELPEVLKNAGVASVPAPKQADESVPKDVLDRLGRMSFVEQFAALRSLHQALRAGGLSTRRLAALVRAYANLGLLTEFQWDAASVAYKARALLYAQRLAVLEPKSPEPRWCQAYAAALGGIPWWAAESLDEARRLAEERPVADRPSPPGWVALIDAWCRSAAGQLAAANQGPDAELAALLHLMTLEHPPHTDVALRAARTAIDANPECFRAHDALCSVSGVANLHVATTVAPEVLSKAVSRRITAVFGLPEAVRKAAERCDEVEMTQALDAASVAATDLAEPSWGALARIVRETRFAFTCRRLEFMSTMWNVPTDDYWKQVRSLVATHRFCPLLESFVTGPASPALANFMAALDTTDLDFNAMPLIRLAGRVEHTSAGNKLSGIVMLLADWTVRDLAMSLDSYSRPPHSVDRAHKLLAISPHSPLAMSHLIADAWDEAEKEREKWQKVVDDHPTFVAALARHFVQAGRTEEAEKSLKRSIELSPDLWAFLDLADLYKKRGQSDLAKQTLDRFLAQVEDHGLDHAKVRVAIADGLMSDGRYAEAWPYAEAAARSWAGWAMTCAQNCAEGLEKWDVAEAFARASSERYPRSMWAVWFLFCERSGHGDIAAARAWTKEFATGLLENPQLATDDLLLVSYIQLIAGDKAKAAAALRRMPRNNDREVYVASMAAAADLAGATDVRDAALEHFCASFAKSSGRAVRILQMIRDVFAAQKPAALDLTAVDEIFVKIPSQHKARVAFVVAAHLMANGREDDAKRYWTVVSARDNPNAWWRVFALATLRDRYSKEPDSKKRPRAI